MSKIGVLKCVVDDEYDSDNDNIARYPLKYYMNGLIDGIKMSKNNDDNYYEGETLYVDSEDDNTTTMANTNMAPESFQQPIIDKPYYEQIIQNYKDNVSVKKEHFQAQPVVRQLTQEEAREAIKRQEIRSANAQARIEAKIQEQLYKNQPPQRFNNTEHFTTVTTPPHRQFVTTSPPRQFVTTSPPRQFVTTSQPNINMITSTSPRRTQDTILIGSHNNNNNSKLHLYVILFILILGLIYIICTMPMIKK